jgi:hypothetical protein
LEVCRQMIIEQIEKMLSGQVSREETGWWAYDIIIEGNLSYEPGHQKILEDVLKSLHYFHDTEPLMQAFYPETEEILYYLVCLKGEEMYQRSRVVHWKV